MNSVVIIAEKASVARSIAQALLGCEASRGNTFTGTCDGSKVVITAASGHLIELARPEAYNEIHGKDFRQWRVDDLPILPGPGWTFKQVLRADSANVFRGIQQALEANAGAEVINACDAGREGELIFRKIAAAANLPSSTKTSRMWIQSMTNEAIKAAFLNRPPLSKYDGLAMAGYTRDEADWLVGMNKTCLATKTLPRGGGDWKVWSIGRVQTPTLALVVERDEQIDGFQTQPFYEVYASFADGHGKAVLNAYADSPQRARLLGVSKIKEDRDRKAFWSLALAETFKAAARTGSYAVSDETSVETSRPPLPLNLAEIQKVASKEFGYTASETLKHLQALYEAKLISYPRVDPRYWPEDMKSQIYDGAKRALEAVRGIFPKASLAQQGIMPESVAGQSRAFDDSKITDHFALSLTGEVGGLPSMGKEQQYIYMVVLRTTLMALDAPATFNISTRRWTQTAGSGDYFPATFQEQRRSIMQAGFRRWGRFENDVKAPFVPVSAGGVMIPLSVDIKERQTAPPERMTDALLIAAMESAGTNFSPEEVADPARAEEMAEAMKDKGIGTQATRASMIDTLLARGYLARDESKKKKEKPLFSTPNGRLLIQQLRGIDPAATSAKFTAEWEVILKRMERNEATLSRENFLQGVLDQILQVKDKFIKQSTRQDDTRPKKNLTDGVDVAGAICPKSKNPIKDRGDAFEAPGWPGVLMWKEAFGRKWTALDFVLLLQGVLDKKPVTFENMVSQKGNTYSAPLTINPDTKRVSFHETKVAVKGAKCPKSGAPLEDHGKFWKALGWPKLRLWKHGFGRDWTAEEYIDLLAKIHKGEPAIKEGLIRKSGSDYSAAFTLNGADAERFELSIRDRDA